MRQKLCIFLIFLAFYARGLAVTPTSSEVDDDDWEVDWTKFVNLFIGTTNDGHVFPGKSPLSKERCNIFHVTCLGATVPHGMVKAGLDTDSPGNVI